MSIDMPAGPSEVLVVADAGAHPAHVAADLLSQAEHGPDSQVRGAGWGGRLKEGGQGAYHEEELRCPRSVLLMRCALRSTTQGPVNALMPTAQVVLVALPGADLEAIGREVTKQCDALPRNETARKALSHSFAVKVRCCAATPKSGHEGSATLTGRRRT